MQMGQVTIPGFSRKIRIGFVDDPKYIPLIYEGILFLCSKGKIAVSAQDMGTLEMAKSMRIWGGDANRSMIVHISDSVCPLYHFTDHFEEYIEWFEVLDWAVIPPPQK